MKNQILTRWSGQAVFTALVVSTVLSACSSVVAAENWPQFRGPNCSGVAEKAKLPVTIGPTDGVLWKAEVPWSPSSPCVWGEQIFLTTFSEGELQTRSYDRRNGQLLWT